MAEKTIAQIFAENVAYYRKKQGHSQYDLAMNSGISRTMISHYEREGMMPPADRLQNLADSLDIPVYKLFKERGEEKTDERAFEANITDIDSRSVKKLRDLLSLPQDDRNDIYRILNKMLRKNQLEKQTQQ
jgi:transcriptional regulator with XRE-family HTH domain